MRRAVFLFVVGVALVAVGGACAVAHQSPSPPLAQPVAAAASPAPPVETDPGSREQPPAPFHASAEDAAASASGDRCPPPDEVDPENCEWHPSIPLPWYGPEERATYWRRSEAAVLWSDWCLQGLAIDAGARERMWSARGPHAPRPPNGLAIVLERQGTWDYSVNVFRDGRVLFRSDRCTEPVRSRRLSSGQVDTLVAAFRAAKLGEHTGCVPPASDVGTIRLDFFDKNDHQTLHTDESCAAPITPLLHLLIQTVGAGTWVP